MKWKLTRELKDLSSINQVEETFGYKFPQDYKELVTEYNCGFPEPNALDTKNKVGVSFGELLNFNLDELDNVLEEYLWVKGKLPSKVFPITINLNDGYLCYDYRENSDNPTIIYWEHMENSEIDEARFEFVANNIAELLSKLYDDTSKWFGDHYYDLLSNKKEQV